MSIITNTGVSRGIGASTAVECARRGLGVILTYKENAEAAQRVASTIHDPGGTAVSLALDVCNTPAFLHSGRPWNGRWSAIGPDSNLAGW